MTSSSNTNSLGNAWLHQRYKLEAYAAQTLAVGVKMMEPHARSAYKENTFIATPVWMHAHKVVGQLMTMILVTAAQIPAVPAMMEHRAPPAHKENTFTVDPAPMHARKGVGLLTIEPATAV